MDHRETEHNLIDLFDTEFLNRERGESLKQEII